jgi:hypothetical protein
VEAGIVLESIAGASTRLFKRKQAEQHKEAQKPQEENHSLFIDASSSTFSSGENRQ